MLDGSCLWPVLVTLSPEQVCDEQGTHFLLLEGPVLKVFDMTFVMSMVFIPLTFS